MFYEGLAEISADVLLEKAVALKYAVRTNSAFTATTIRSAMFNIEICIEAQKLRGTRPSKPFIGFYHVFLEIFEVTKELEQVSPKTKWVLERSILILLVTAMEVYCKDMLAMIFKECKSESFAKLIEAHKEKYAVSDMLDLQEIGITPFEVIVDAQNFQNVDCIESVFKILLKK